MRSVVRVAIRALIPAMVLALALGCSGDQGDEPSPEPSRESTPTPSRTESAPTPKAAELEVTVRGKGLSGEQENVRDGIAGAVRAWFDGAYLGSFPRESYPHAFDSFTNGAAASAQDHPKVMTGQRYGETLESLTPTRQTADAEVWVKGGEPAGAKAAVHLVAEGTSEDGKRREVEVHGTVQLTPKGERWRIFGFDIETTVR